MRATISRFDPFRGESALQDQINRLFTEAFDRSRKKPTSPLGRRP